MILSKNNLDDATTSVLTGNVGANNNESTKVHNPQRKLLDVEPLCNARRTYTCHARACE